MHLELQRTMFMPLTSWAIPRSVAGRSWSFGLVSGFCIWLQLLSCIYYGVVLSMTVAVPVPLAMLRSPRDGARALPARSSGKRSRSSGWNYSSTSQLVSQPPIDGEGTTSAPSLLATCRSRAGVVSREGEI